MIRELIRGSLDKFYQTFTDYQTESHAVHLSMSMVVLIYLALQIYCNWYPEPCFRSMEAGRVFG